MLLGLLLALPLPGFSQEKQRLYPLATNFEAEGKILELNVPAELDGQLIILAFRNSFGEQRVFVPAGRAGIHCYEVRHFMEWQGIITYVVTTSPAVSGRVKAPTFLDTVDMFLAPQRIIPSTINALESHTLLSWQWTMMLLFIFVFAVAFFFLSKKTPIVAIVLGFLAAWTLMDLRTTVDHATIIYKKERYKQGMMPFVAAKQFSDRAADIIGKSTWGHARLDALTRSFVRYRLAEHPLSPAGDQAASFWITQNPSDGQTVFQFENFYLVKRNTP